MVKTYVKRPVEIQAVQWTGDNKSEIKEFVGDAAQFWQLYSNDYPKYGLNIQTLEGTHYASVGDYIIRGIKGEFYPCKPDIFVQTYEEVC